MMRSLGTSQKKKGGGRRCFLKISGHLWEETLGYSALQYHLGQKSLLLKGHFGHFCAVLIGRRPRTSFRCHPPLVDNLIFFLKHLRVWHVWNVATCVGVPIISGALSSGICRLRFSVAMLFFSLHVHQQWFQYRQIVPVSLLIVR